VNIHYNILSNLKRSIKFVYSVRKKWPILNTGISVFNGILPLCFILLIKQIIDAITNVSQSQNNSFQFDYLIILIAIAGLVFLINEILSNLAQLTKENHIQEVNDLVFDKLHEKSSQLDLEHFENQKYQDILFRARTEAVFRPARIINSILAIWQNSFSLILSIVILFWVHWSIALILLAAIIPGVFIRVKYARFLFEWNKKNTSKERRSRYLNFLAVGEKYIKDIRLFGLENYFKTEFKTVRKELKQERLKLMSRRVGIEILGQVFTALAIFGSFIFIAKQTIDGAMTAGTMVLFFLAFQRGFTYFRGVVNNLANLYEDSLFLNYYHEFLSLEPKINRQPDSISFGKKFLVDGMKIENLSFTYPGSDIKILQNINFEIKAGETLAIVGENGAGKSTLIKLLCRFYDPDTGKILLDGTDIKNIELDTYRNSISALFQDFSQFHFSIKDNIAFGNVQSEFSYDDFSKATNGAGIEKLLRKFPDKENTLLGNTFEKSSELSIGEWQKIALARFFYRQSLLVFMDEPTSHLDSETEALFHSYLTTYLKDKTAVIISHKIPTLQIADRIIVLAQNTIAETGTYEELMSKKGAYYSMIVKGSNC